MEQVARLTEWMITEGRRSGDPVKVVSQFCSSLTEAGVPLWRANIGQRFANPLLIAWGVVWTPESTDSYDVTHETMLTDGYVGSSFEYILANRKPLHKSLRQLDLETEHSSYLEFAEQGGTDYYATLLYYGDGSLHGCTLCCRNLAPVAGRFDCKVRRWSLSRTGFRDTAKQINMSIQPILVQCFVTYEFAEIRCRDC